MSIILKTIPDKTTGKATEKSTEKDFIDLPWDLHGSDSNWVPPLKIAVKDLLNEKKNPFFKHAKIQRWVAYKDGKRAGRIAAIVDEVHNKFHEEKTAFWGFFESINEIPVAKAMFETVEKWSRERGMNTIRGPMNPSTNHECGMQISAFDTKPFIMMTQNPPYYPELVEKCGHTKAKDLYAWLLDGNTIEFDPKLIARACALQKSGDIKFRDVNMSRYDEEVENLLMVYNDAWEKNWGFVPMNDEEFRHMAKEMKLLVNPRMLQIVEVRGEVAAFGLWLPDINQVFDKIRDGKLFPTGLLKLLWNTKVNKKAMNRGRMLTLGVRKKFQPLGLGALLYYNYLKVGPELGYPVCECSWILEDNIAMNKAMKYMDGKLYKTYRIYDKQI